MSGAEQTKQRFHAAMEKVAVGARLARSNVDWTITKSTSMDCSQRLELRHGRRTMTIYVPVCITGPCLSDVGMRSVSGAPKQRGLIPGIEGGAA